VLCVDVAGLGIDRWRRGRIAQIDRVGQAATANELNPELLGTFHNTLGPPAGQLVAIFSAVDPSWRGPRYSVQSAPWEAMAVAIKVAKANGRCMV